MTDTPDNKAGAPEGQPAGEASPQRAELLGATALTARVRCACGRRQDLERDDWQWFGVTLCPRCGQGILHDSLRAVSRREALTMIEGRKPTEGELRTLRRLELALRQFILRYDGGLRWHWAPTTNATAEEVGGLLAELDRSRRERGAPPVGASGRASPDAGGPGEGVGGVAGGEGWGGEGDGDEDFEGDEYEENSDDEDSSADADE